MPRCFERRSSSMGSFCAESIDRIKPEDCETSVASKAEDLETARQLLSSLLYIKDASGRSYLHTNFHLSWAKALLDRAKSLDEGSEQYIHYRMTDKDQYKNGRYRNGSHKNKDSTFFTSRVRSNTADGTNSSSTLMQRRFILQRDKESGYTPFHIAIMERNLAAILLFLRHATADETSAERLTQRPMTLLHAAEANSGRNRTNSYKNNRSNNNLLLAMANATDHEGLTPLRLLGRLQQPELFRCRNYLLSFRPSVDLNATMRLRTRHRQSSFDNNSNGNDSEDENIDYFSENADLLQINEADLDDEENSFATDNVSYAYEVVTFGRPHHCALGVVQGGSSSSSAFVTSSNKDNINQTYSHGSAFCPQRVQEFAQEIIGRQGSAMAVAAATHHSLVVTKNGHLFAFGLGKGGRLGLGDDHPQQCPLPNRVLGPLQRRQVVSVAAAENHSLCVTSQGDVYSWGSNRFGQLGDHATGSSPVAPCGSRSIPRRVENLKQHPCVAVAAGEKHSVALSRKGEVYVWGDNMSGQLGVSRRTGIQKIQRVEALWETSTSQGRNNSRPKITIAIAAAAQSTLVLTTGSPSSRLTNVNAVYEWGHGNHVPIRVHFESYNKSANKKNDNGHRSSSFASSFGRTPNPTAIACARYHNVAITSDGMVYTWGLHAESLGRSNSNKFKQHHQRRDSSPQLVSGMLPEKGGGFAVAVDASESHTAVVCNSGALFTWGTTDGNNVLGHEGVRWQPNPKRVPGVHRAVDVAVAKEHTILLIGTSFPSIPKNGRLLCLDVLAAHKVAEYIDLFNVIPILMMAERTQSFFLIEYCTSFVHKNLDGVLNVSKKTVMNQYLNDMLAETTYRAGKRYRDDHHHPLNFDVLAAGNVGRPTFDRNWFSGFEEWIQGCKELVESRFVRRLLGVVAVREYEEDSRGLNFKARRSSSCQTEFDDLKQRTRSTSESSFISDVKEGHLDRCIKRTAKMDLSTIELANQNAAWLSKEIRSVRKKLKQISHLIDTETQKVALSSEQKAKVARHPTLETELSIYESAVKEVTKRIKELNIENETDQQQLSSAKVDKGCRQVMETPTRTIGTKNNESILVGDAKKAEDPPDSMPDQNDKKPFYCNICGVKCSDKSNFILHQNGRKHRNKVAQLAEEEKEKTAASIHQQQQIELMKSAPMFTPSSKKVAKNAWGTTSLQPNYKLPPPPHPVLAQVALSPSQRSPKDARSAPPNTIPACSSSNVKSVANYIGRVKQKKSHQSVNADSPSSMKSVSPAASNFTTILREQEIIKKTLYGGMKESPKSLAWDSSPSSTRCVPLSLYSAPDNSFTPDRVQNSDDRSTSISLADFLTPPKKNPASSPGTAPWMKDPVSQPEISPTPNPKSIAQIQAEEESLRSKQDKSYGKGGGSWYVERRERADSVMEIQKVAQDDLKHRLLVEEQLKIEAQIREENERRQTLEKGKSKKDRGAPRRRNKKFQNSKKCNQSNSTKIETKASENSKSNRSNGKKKSSDIVSKKVATKSPRQPQKAA